MDSFFAYDLNGFYIAHKIPLVKSDSRLFCFFEDQKMNFWSVVFDLIKYVFSRAKIFTDWFFSIFYFLYEEYSTTQNTVDISIVVLYFITKLIVILKWNA